MADGQLQMVTPLPPARSGIAQYSSDLLDAVDGRWHVTVLPENDDAALRWSTVKVARARGGARFDPRAPIVYQLGNSGHHRRAFVGALRAPGVLVLHDVVLHHGRLGEFLRTRGGAEYRRQLAARYGAPGARLADAVLRGQTPADLSEFPFFEDFVERARVTLVHSDYARQLVLARVPSAEVRRVPMGIPLPADVSRLDARRALGLPAEAFVVASVTHVNPYKRLPVVLRAVRRIVRQIPQTLVLIAGSVAPSVDLQSDIDYLGLGGRVRLLGYVPDATARLAAAAADVCVNLRYPSAGETSASLLRLLGAGRPVIVTDDLPNAEYPDDVVLKIGVDRFEEQILAAQMLDLHAKPELARARGERARAYVASEHALGYAVAGYRAAVYDAYGSQLPDLGRLTVQEAAPSLPEVEAAESSWSLVEELLAGRIAGSSLEQHVPTLDALAAATVELGLSNAQPQQRRTELDMSETPPINPELLEILACPVCKTAVRLEGNELICDNCGRRYQIEDGIPIMLVEERAK
jgi:uncharacterized protein YbaR (Trm112 family)/glycosyltransferase involved in cell wall biosynthesis